MRTIKFLLVLVMLTSLILAGCAPAATEAPAEEPAGEEPAAEGPAEGEPVELVFWSMWNEPEPQAQAIRACIEIFEEANPNVTVSSVWNGRENQTKLRTALGAGTKVDLMDQDADQVAGGMMSEGLGYALDDWLDQPAVDEDTPVKDVFVPGVMDLNKGDDGHYYLWPYVTNPVMWWYNKDIFAEAGAEPPETWQEFLDVAEKIKQAGYAPIYNESDVDDYYGFFLNYAVERIKGPGFLLASIEDETGEMWKDPTYIQVFEMINTLWDNGYLPEEVKGYIWPAGQQTLAVGESAMGINGGWLPTELREAAGPDFNWGGFRFPAIEGGAGTIDDLHPWLLSFMILKDSEHPEEAFEFLKYMISTECQTIMADEALVGVTRKGVEWTEAIADGATASESANIAITHLDGGTAKYPEFVKNVLYVHLRPAFLAEITPEEFAENMAADAKAYWESR